MREYPKKYISIYRGIPILIGDNPLEVIKESYRIYGNYPFFIGHLSEKEDEVYV